MTKIYSERRAELEHQNTEKLCVEFLGSCLIVDPDYEKENENDPDAYKTEDKTFYFVPQLDDPVMTRRTLSGEHPIPGKYKYSIEVIKCFPGGHMEPDDYDQVELGRADSLAKAIGFAAHCILDWKLESAGEGRYWEMESILEKEFGLSY